MEKNFAVSSAASEVQSVSIAQGEFHVTQAEIDGNGLKVTVNTAGSGVGIGDLLLCTTNEQGNYVPVTSVSPVEGAYYISDEMLLSSDMESISQWYFDPEIVYSMNSSAGTSMNIRFTDNGSASYTVYPTAEQNFTAQITTYVENNDGWASYKMRVKVTMDEALGAVAAQEAKLYYFPEDNFTGSADYFATFGEDMEMLDENGQILEAVLNAGTVNQNCYSTNKVYFKVHLPQ